MKRSMLILTIVMAGLVLGFGSTGLASLTDGLVGYWGFDEGTGTIAHDYSVNNHDGTLYGPTWVDGIVDNALSFDGSNDYVEVPDADAFDPSSQEITIAAWVNLSTYQALTSSAYFTIAGKTASPTRPIGSYYFGINNSNTAYAGVEGTLAFGVCYDGLQFQGGRSSSLVPTNTWIHVAFTHDINQNSNFYIDGQSEPFVGSTITQDFADNSIPFRIGHANSYWDYFRGIMDEVRIYDRALSGSEIGELASGTPPGPPPEPCSFVHITDTHIGALLEDADLSLAAAVLEICNLSPSPDFVLVTGDIADLGCLLLCGRYGLFKTIMQDLEYKNIKYYCIPGNHDRYITSLAGYKAEIGLPEGVSILPLSDGVGNYWFEHKGFMLIGLDTGPGINFAPNHLTDDQMLDLNWCALQGASMPKIVFMHHPAAGGGDKMIVKNRDAFLDWCDKQNAMVVITGHTHEDVVCDRNGKEGWPVGETAYVQTPSCGTGAVGDRGYRIFDVIGGKVSERGVSHIQNTLDYYIKIKPLSPVDLHVYDSQGGHVGVGPSGEVERGIPRSFYLPKHSVETEDGSEVYPEKILIFDPTDDYLYEVVGTEEGTYGLVITSVNGGEETTFEAADIPTSPGARHIYAVDWGALSAGEEGVILNIDNDGDGVFVQMVIADNELSYDEFALQTETVVDFDPDTLNLKSKGKFVTVYIELPDDFDVSEIDLFSLALNELVPPLPKPIGIGDYDNDGINDLMVKFDRQELIAILEPGEQIIDLTGRLWDGRRIAGFDFIRVIH